MCFITGAHLIYPLARIRKDIRADCFCSCELRCSRLSEFCSPVYFDILQYSSSNHEVCAIPGTHLQSSKPTRHSRRAAGFVVVTCAVPVLSVFTPLLFRSGNQGVRYFRRTPGLDCSYWKRHSCRLFLQL